MDRNVTDTILDELADLMRGHAGPDNDVSLPDMERLAAEVGAAHGLDGETVFRAFVEARGDRYTVGLVRPRA